MDHTSICRRQSFLMCVLWFRLDERSTFCLLYTHILDTNCGVAHLPSARAPHLGRELVCKESKKNFKATIAMSQDFPLGIESWVAHHAFSLCVLYGLHLKGCSVYSRIEQNRILFWWRTEEKSAILESYRVAPWLTKYHWRNWISGFQMNCNLMFSSSPSSLTSLLQPQLVSACACGFFFFLCRLLNVLEVIAPFKHFNKLREFVQMKLPPGFPVKLGERGEIVPRRTLPNAPHVRRSNM